MVLPNLQYATRPTGLLYLMVQHLSPGRLLRFAAIKPPPTNTPMKKTALIIASLVLGASLHAQTPAPAPPAATPAPASSFSIYGWVEAGATLNSKQPNDRQNFGRLFDDRANELMLNQVVLTAEKTLAPKAGESDWGFKLQGMFGSDARFIHSLGLLDNASNKILQPDIVEAYFSYHLPVLSAGGIDVKAGKFVTLEGAETIDPRTDPFYSHTYIFNFGIPFNHTGVLATFHASKMFDLMAGITRGVNTSIDDNNHSYSFHGGIGFNGLADGKLTGAFSTHFGPETPNDNKSYRYLNDLTFTYTLSDKDSLITDLNYIKDDAVKAKGYGIAEYFIHKVSDTLTVQVRGEIWKDRDGFYVAQFGNNDDVMNALRGNAINDPRTVGGGSTTYRAITVGLSYKPSVAKPFTGLTIRPELRYDQSSDTKAFVDSKHKSQLTLGIDAVLTF